MLKIYHLLKKTDSFESVFFRKHGLYSSANAMQKECWEGNAKEHQKICDAVPRLADENRLDFFPNQFLHTIKFQGHRAEKRKHFQQNLPEHFTISFKQIHALCKKKRPRDRQAKIRYTAVGNGNEQIQALVIREICRRKSKHEHKKKYTPHPFWDRQRFFFCQMPQQNPDQKNGDTIRKSKKIKAHMIFEKKRKHEPKRKHSNRQQYFIRYFFEYRIIKRKEEI